MERSECAVQVRFLLAWNQVSQRGRKAKGWPGRKPRAGAQNKNAVTPYRPAKGQGGGVGEGGTTGTQRDRKRVRVSVMRARSASVM